MSPPEKQLLDYKINKFVEVINFAQKHCKRQTNVRFTDGYCPYSSSSDEIAHIHLDQPGGLICVSKYMLRAMNFDDIVETALHEFAHLYEASHDSKFGNILSDLRIAYGYHTIGPPPASGGSSLTPNKRDTTNECQYHLCKVTSKLTKCPYCREKYCPEHITPLNPSMPDFRDNTVAGQLKYLEYLKDGHPCLEFAKHKYKIIEPKESEVEFSSDPEVVSEEFEAVAISAKHQKMKKLNKKIKIDVTFVIALQDKKGKYQLSIKRKYSTEIVPVDEIWSDSKGIAKIKLFQGEYIASLIRERPVKEINVTVDNTSKKQKIMLYFIEKIPNYWKDQIPDRTKIEAAAKIETKTTVEEPIDDSFEVTKKKSFVRNLKCKLGFHNFTVLGDLSNAGQEEFVKKYKCTGCGKIISKPF